MGLKLIVKNEKQSERGERKLRVDGVNTKVFTQNKEEGSEEKSGLGYGVSETTEELNV